MGYVEDFRRRIRGGELGSIPVVIGLIIIAIVFEAQTGTFMTPRNLSNISVYIAGPGIMAVGIVLVLLLGEIDLSIGSVAGLSAAIWAVLSVTHGVDDVVSILLAIAAGAAVGTVHGVFFAKVGVPAFVVTLAGFLGWSGVQIWVMGEEGTINIPRDSWVRDFTDFYFSDISAAYTLAALITAGYVLLSWRHERRRAEAQLAARPLTEILIRGGLVALISFVTAYTLNQHRGLPLALVLFLAVLLLADFMVRRTTYGRQIFAVGGNAEAARRAGINVARVRLTVFTIAGALAAFGGLFLAGQGGGASKSLGSGNLLMNVIAAAVIGGTSLFGGRGWIWSALLGTLVIQSITSGLNLMNMSAEIQYMITGAVLLIAVVLDSVSRRTQRTAGRT
ncbi:sugar ABC transporter permease [Streptomyces radicis]|uniref:Xylose transport system permease protein XylH n=2 Tax=Streptomyces radicis TaxID=1750517 RepID=A0A3A9VTL0_9ACTN|nr:sugar ABC transporter permease [Streptomyces radicis]RKN04109.1 sugar ABC transporter permease [Streptomyces radicis]RKN14464.1 sugar ABC transporter permease [Streptomyces radicis]